MVKVYVEGGGHQNSTLAQDVHKGFQSFFTKAGFDKRPAVVVCGSRQMAYNDYCIAIKAGKSAMLLVDSESPVQEEFEKGNIHDWKPWEQIQSRKDQSGNKCDKWERIGVDTDCHLMVQMMESWFLADVEALKKYFSEGFKETKFPKDDENIEKMSKKKIEDIFNSSTKDTKKEGYKKGRDSFIILSQIDPQKVRSRSKWAERFLCLLKERIDSM